MTLFDYLRLDFVRYAFIVGTLIALTAALLGVSLVLKRFSFIGDGLSHIAFGAMAVAGVLGLSDNTPLVLVITVICAVLILRTGKNPRINGDAAIAMISVGAMAVGYLLLNIFPSSGNLAGDVCSTLFGSVNIITLSLGDLLLCLGVCALAIALFIAFYHKIFAVTFDENFARSTGLRSQIYDTAMAVMTAVVIVVAMELVGSLLISALIIFPALCAMRLFGTFRAVTVAAAVISVVCAVSGMTVALLAGLPVGASIVCADIVAFGVCAVVGRVRR